MATIKTQISTAKNHPDEDLNKSLRCKRGRDCFQNTGRNWEIVKVISIIFLLENILVKNYF